MQRERTVPVRVPAPAMGRVGGAKEWMGTQRPMGAAVVAMVASLVLLSAPAGQAVPWDSYICPLVDTTKSVELFPHETTFFGTNSLTINVSVKIAGCVNDTRLLNLSEFTASNVTSKRRGNLKWYEFSYLNCGKNVTKIGSKTVKFKLGNLQQCPSTRITLSVGSDVRLAKKCSSSARRKKVQQNKAVCKALLEGVPVVDHHSFITESEGSSKYLFDLIDKQRQQKETFNAADVFLSNQQDPFAPAGDSNNGKNIFNTPELISGSQQEPKEPEVNLGDTYMDWKMYNALEDYLHATSATPPSYIQADDAYLDSDSGYTTRRNYEENAIPIFIGIVAFTVSMCLRFCLCRGKSVVRRVTTVTVIRGRPVGGPDAPQDQQDPPPSYIDVVNEATSPQSTESEGSAELPPPAYADIVDEVQPPTYSELEAQSTSEEVPLADQEAEAHTTQPQPDSEPTPDAKGSEPSKNMLSKYRSRQKQFAFKVLDEDE